MKEPWDDLSRSVWGEEPESGNLASESRNEEFEALAHVRNALDRRQECRERVLNALKRAGATELTIQQVEEAMDRRASVADLSEFEALQTRFSTTWQSRAAQDSWHEREADTHAHYEPTTLPSPRGERGQKRAGLGCNLEHAPNGMFRVSRVIPGGACAQSGIPLGATILSVNGVPLCGLSIHDVRQVALGAVGTHVSVRYRPPDVHAEHPPIEKVLTRMPSSVAGDHNRSSFANSESGSRYEYQHPEHSRPSWNGRQEHTGVRKNSAALDNGSVWRWLGGLSGSLFGLHPAVAPSLADKNGPRTNGLETRDSEAPDSEEARLSTELRRENIRQLADAHMESTHGKAPSVASGTYHTQFSSNMNRPVSIPASDVIARQPQSVSNRDLQRVVEGVLNRRSHRLSQLLDKHPRSETLKSIIEKEEMWKNRPNDETLEAFTHESREYISATSVFCTDGLQSGRDYLYPEQDFEDTQTREALEPIVLQKERKSLWNNLRSLEHSLASLAHKERNGQIWVPGDDDDADFTDKTSYEKEGKEHPSLQSDDNEMLRATEEERRRKELELEEARRREREELRRQEDERRQMEREEEERRRMEEEERRRMEEEERRRIEEKAEEEAQRRKEQEEAARALKEEMERKRMAAAKEEAERQSAMQQPDPTPLYYTIGAGNLHVHIKCAKGLPAMDLSTGACDPYVKVSIAGEVHQTEVIKRNKDPTWNQKFLAHIASIEGQNLVCQIWDWNSLMSHSEIGSVELRLAEVRLNDKGESNELWLDVMGKHHGRDGKLCIVLTSDSPSPVFAEGRTQAERSVSPIERLASSETAAVMAMLTAEQEAEMSKPLPPGWKVYWSKSKNKPYYKHKESGQIVWNIPPQEDGAAKSEGSV